MHIIIRTVIIKNSLLNCFDFSVCHQSNSSGSHALKTAVSQNICHIIYDLIRMNLEQTVIQDYVMLFVTKENLKQDTVCIARIEVLCYRYSIQYINQYHIHVETNKQTNTII